MEISQFVKDIAAKQAAEFQKTTQQIVTPPAAADNKTLTPQAVQATEKASDSVKLKYSATSKNLDTVSAIEQMHSRLNQLAKDVRKTNEGLNAASEGLEQMQTTIQKIVKNFPPFSADSPERQRLLMSYISIRKEMEKLMVPPPPSPIYEKVQGMWYSLLDSNGQIKSSAAPTLDSSSSDSQLNEATATLEKSSTQLSTLSDNITKAFVQN
jgi:cysteinyl-tRNA synthetase